MAWLSKSRARGESQHSCDSHELFLAGAPRQVYPFSGARRRVRAVLAAAKNFVFLDCTHPMRKDVKQKHFAPSLRETSIRCLQDAFLLLGELGLKGGRGSGRSFLSSEAPKSA